MIKLIAETIQDKFGLKAEMAASANLMLIRVPGLDNNSLANWILDEFKDIKVTVKSRAAYQFSDTEWVKIEQTTDGKELVLTS